MFKPGRNLLGFRLFAPIRKKISAMKPRALLSSAALVSALIAVACAVVQSRQHRREIVRLREMLALEQTRTAEPSEHAPAFVAPPPPSVPSGEAPPPTAAEAIPAAAEPAVAAPAPPAEEPWLAQFDRAMDREFARIEAREASCRDPAELAGLGELKTALADLDRTWTDMDSGAKSPAEREALANQARNQMVAVMRLAAADRNLRLARVAQALGVEEATRIEQFIVDVDQVFRDTDLDWATLFGRGF